MEVPVTNKINLSPEAKRELQRLRRKIAREQARSAQAEMDSARTELSIRKSAQSKKEGKRQSIAILRHLVGLCRAVNASFGVSVPVHLQPQEGYDINRDRPTSPIAYTDYQSITVKYPLPYVRTGKGAEETLYANDPQSLARLVSEVKAFQYHELGHILFSLPLSSLFTEAHAHTPETWAKTQGVGELYYTQYEVKRTNNILEDQRMETALVHESPYLARYLTLVVLNWVLNDGKFRPKNINHPLGEKIAEASQYLLVVNRRYLPIDVRRASRKKFAEVYGEANTVRAETIIRAYCSATNSVDMVKATFLFHQFLEDIALIPPKMDEHWNSGGKPKKSTEETADSSDEQDDDDRRVRVSKSKDTDDESTTKQSTGKDDDDEAEEESGAGDDDESDSSEDEGNSKGNSDSDADDSDDSDGDTGSGSDSDGDEGDGDSDGDGSQSSSSNADSDSGDDGDSDGSDSPIAGTNERTSDEVTQESNDLNNRLKELQQETSESISGDADITDTLRNINHDMNADGDVPLRPETRVSPMLDDLKVTAEEISGRLTRSFDSAVSSALPVWEEGHREGILNPFRYRTRLAGDHNYRRTLSSEGNTGLDIAVSLLLDTSGSMCQEGGNLGVSAWAIKNACDRVGVDCTVLTFDSDSRELWRAEDRNVEPVVLHPNGGTDPKEAISRLDSHRNGQTYHLVIVLTDGIWSGDVTFDDHASDGRIVLGVALGSETYAQYLTSQRGVHQAVTINDLNELPEIVRNFLLNFLG